MTDAAQSRPPSAFVHVAGWDVRLTPDLYPLLSAALVEERGSELRRELEALLQRFWRDRAPRYPARVEARMLLPGQSDAVTVQAEDISTSGVRLTVPFGTQVDLLTQHRCTLLLRADDGTTTHLLRLGVRMVRMAEVTDEGARLAFAFDEGPDADLLRHLVDLTG
jgi:hypothetical protein